MALVIREQLYRGYQAQRVRQRMAGSVHVVDHIALRINLSADDECRDGDIKMDKNQRPLPLSNGRRKICGWSSLKTHNVCISIPICSRLLQNMVFARTNDWPAEV
jgi:hypothetical protein